MFFWIINISIVFILCVFFAGVLIPRILLISYRKKLFDLPDERKIHNVVVPRLGGFAFIPVILFSMALLLGLNLISGRSEALLELENNVVELLFGFCAIIVLYLVGIADDLIGVRYRAKFGIQIFCALMLMVGGLWIDNLHGALGVYVLPAWIGYLLSVFVIVFIINAINLIDGIDGLASGLSGVALFFYGLTFVFLCQYIYAMLAFATLGVLVTFFIYNVFGNAERGRKIFMGDTGSLTIGILLSFLSIKLSLHTFDDNGSFPNPFLLAFSPLIIPCFDVVRVFIHRVRMKKHPFMPDQSHIHHKLLALGIPQRVAMIIIVTVSLVFTLCNILLSKYVNINLLLIGDIFVWTVANIWLTDRIKKRNVMCLKSQSKLAINNQLKI